MQRGHRTEGPFWTRLGAAGALTGNAGSHSCVRLNSSACGTSPSAKIATQASAMAFGTSASARTTRARFFSTSAVCSRHGHGQGLSLLGFGLEHLLVGFGLFVAKVSANILAHIDVRNINGENFERGPGIKTFAQHGFGNAVGVFEHFLVGLRRSRWRTRCLRPPGR